MDNENKTLYSKVFRSLELTNKRVFLNFKLLTKNKTVFFLLLAIPTLFTLTAATTVAISYSIGTIIVASNMISCLIIYGSVAGSFRRSTLNKNSNLTVGEKWIDNSSTLITMLFLGFIIITYILLMIMILNVTGILLIDINQYSSSFNVRVLLEMNLLQIYYWGLLTAIITYSVAYFFQSFFDSEKVFINIGVIFTILLLIFGCILNDYFNIKYERSFINPPEKAYIDYGKYGFMGTGMYIPSLFFPYYAPAQMINLNGDLILNVIHYNIDFNKWTLWSFVTESNSLINSKDLWRFNILWFIPYFHIFLWWIIGFSFKKYIKYK